MEQNTIYKLIAIIHKTNFKNIPFKKLLKDELKEAFTKKADIELTIPKKNPYLTRVALYYHMETPSQEKIQARIEKNHTPAPAEEMVGLLFNIEHKQSLLSIQAVFQSKEPKKKSTGRPYSYYTIV